MSLLDRLERLQEANPGAPRRLVDIVAELIDGDANDAAWERFLQTLSEPQLEEVQRIFDNFDRATEEIESGVSSSPMYRPQFDFSVRRKK